MMFYRQKSMDTKSKNRQEDDKAAKSLIEEMILILSNTYFKKDEKNRLHDVFGGLQVYAAKDNLLAQNFLLNLFYKKIDNDLSQQWFKTMYKKIKEGFGDHSVVKKFDQYPFVNEINYSRIPISSLIEAMYLVRENIKNNHPEFLTVFAMIHLFGVGYGKEIDTLTLHYGIDFEKARDCFLKAIRINFGIPLSDELIKEKIMAFKLLQSLLEKREDFVAYGEVIPLLFFDLATFLRTEGVVNTNLLTHTTEALYAIGFPVVDFMREYIEANPPPQINEDEKKFFKCLQTEHDKYEQNPGSLNTVQQDFYMKALTAILEATSHNPDLAPHTLDVPKPYFETYLSQFLELKAKNDLSQEEKEFLVKITQKDSINVFELAVLFFKGNYPVAFGDIKVKSNLDFALELASRAQGADLLIEEIKEEKLKTLSLKKE